MSDGLPSRCTQIQPFCSAWRQACLRDSLGGGVGSTHSGGEGQAGGRYGEGGRERVSAKRKRAHRSAIALAVAVPTADIDSALGNRGSRIGDAETSGALPELRAEIGR